MFSYLHTICSARGDKCCSGAKQAQIYVLTAIRESIDQSQPGIFPCLNYLIFYNLTTGVPSPLPYENKDI